VTDSFAKLLLENVQPRSGRGSWHGGPTPVGSLRGVSASQAAWLPARGRKSIWQLALHIAYWDYAVRRRLEGGSSWEWTRFPRSPANWPKAPERADEKVWAEDVALLKSEHERLAATIERIPSKRYGTALSGGKRWTIGELIVGIAQHEAYHTGQIQLVKRLWQTAHPA
jgi:uncharacterized damage-inducible protein DinB